MTLMMN